MMIKYCNSCGRPFGNYIKLLNNPDIKYCSKLCRKEKLEKRDIELENYILRKLHQTPSNICPSLASREFFNHSWRANHQRTIKACRRLFLSEEILIQQKKKTIKDLNFRGPFRILIKNK